MLFFALLGEKGQKSYEKGGGFPKFGLFWRILRRYTLPSPWSDGDSNILEQSKCYHTLCCTRPEGRMNIEHHLLT
jgi:hypothetical protein